MFLPQVCPGTPLGQPLHEPAKRSAHALSGGAPAAPPIFASVEKYYAGVGSRKTPMGIRKRMRNYAAVLAERGYILRSGGAPGADTAFERGTRPEQRVIYLPYRGFNGHWSDGIVMGNDESFRRITAYHHPNWSACDEYARRMHTRNAPQILGHTQPVTLSDFVLCWTYKASGGGGTGQAIRIANAYGVPVYDLADRDNTFEQDWLH